MSNEEHPSTSQTFSPITTAGIFMSASSASWGKWSSNGVQILSTAIISITSPVSRRKHYRNSSADGASGFTIRSTRLETTWCNLHMGFSGVNRCTLSRGLLLRPARHDSDYLRTYSILGSTRVRSARPAVYLQLQRTREVLRYFILHGCSRGRGYTYQSQCSLSCGTLASPLDYSSQTRFGSWTGTERVPRIGLIYWHL
jgi:hypothetical protein